MLQLIGTLQYVVDGFNAFQVNAHFVMETDKFFEVVQLVGLYKSGVLYCSYFY